MNLWFGLALRDRFLGERRRDERDRERDRDLERVLNENNRRNKFH